MNVFEMTDTWNDAGTTFSAISMDVTDTASASESRLLDLKVGGADRFFVRKDGRMSVTDGIFNGSNVQISSTEISLSNNFNKYVHLGRLFSGGFQTGMAFAGGSFLGFQASANANIALADARLYHDGTGAIAQRSGAIAQAFHLYNTYTDASNYERGIIRWSGNQMQIGTDAAGTGTARGLSLSTGGRVASILLGNTYNQIDFNAGSFVFSGASIKMAFLPTSDPADAGRLWNDAGTLKISAG